MASFLPRLTLVAQFVQMYLTVLFLFAVKPEAAELKFCGATNPSLLIFSVQNSLVNGCQAAKCTTALKILMRLEKKNTGLHHVISYVSMIERSASNMQQ